MKQSWISDIQAVRTRARWMLLLQRLAILTALTLLALILLAFADFLLRLPSAGRLTQLAALIAAFIYGLYRYLRPAILFRPTLTQIALRAESHLPNLRGHLASGLEFALSGIDRKSPLAARAVADARKRAQQTPLREIIQPKRTITDISLSLLILIATTTLVVAMPTHASIAARRIFTPLSAATWPKRTGVTSQLTQNVYPTGRALNLRCEITRGFNEHMRVYAHYRVIPAANDTKNNPNPPFKRILLTYQHDQLFERLIEPAGTSVELWFETDDDRTPNQTITLVPPPEIENATLQITPPPYARQSIEVNTIDLGSGHDDRALRAPAILRGSSIKLTLTLNKPLALLNESLPWQTLLGYHTDTQNKNTPAPINIHPENKDNSQSSDRWLLEWTMTENVNFSPHLIDQYGIAGSDDARFRIDMTEDHPPTISMTDPLSDMTVLPDAEIQLAAEARDDVQLHSLRLEALIHSSNSTSDQSAAPSPDTNSSTNNSSAISKPKPIIIDSLTGTDRVESLKSSLALKDLSVKPGDLVELSATAADTFELGSESHPEIRSTPRQLRIISQAEFVEQIYRDLSAVRQRAISIVSDQNKLRSRMEIARQSPTDTNGKPVATIETRDRREQARLTQRISRQQEQLKAVRDRLTKNNFNDEDLQNTLRESLKQINQAGQLSEQSAADAAQAEQQQNTRLKSPQPTRETTPEKQLRDQVNKKQQQVEQTLSELIDLLDRGEDAWGARRDIEKLLQQQNKIKNQSEQQLNKTRGRNLDELTQKEKEQLKKLASDQQALSQKARVLIDDLHQRAEKTKKTNPDLAQSMQKAAKRADQDQLAQQMKNASAQLSQNQGSRAQSSQQSAAETLKSMLDHLENTRKARLQRLSRQLASLIESIKGLITDQETNINNLKQAKHNNQFTNLDHQMITLNRNTYSVADMAVKADKQFQGVADHLTDATASQEAAITYLRAQPINPDNAQAEENTSLSLLTEALNQAEELQKKNDKSLTRQKRQELKKQYEALYKRQNAFNKSSQPFINDMTRNENWSRRNRAEARKYAAQQAEIQSDVNNLLKTTQEITQSPVFNASHQRIDTLAQSVIDNYRRSSLDPTVLMRQREIANILQSLAQSLENNNDDDSEFKDQQGGGGAGGKGGGGPQPLIPPASQLRLLQGLQKTIYNSTRELSETENLTSDQKTNRVGEIGSSQKELVGLAQEVLNKLQQGNQPPPKQPDNHQNENQPND